MVSRWKKCYDKNVFLLLNDTQEVLDPINWFRWFRFLTLIHALKKESREISNAFGVLLMPLDFLNMLCIATLDC